MAQGAFASMLRRYAGTIVAAVVLLALLAVAVRFMVFGWTSTDAHISGHGWTALVLGISLSLIVGVGLMGLIFFSARRGYDQPPRFDGS